MLRVVLFVIAVLLTAWIVSAQANHSTSASLPDQKSLSTASGQPTQTFPQTEKVKGHVKKIDTTKHTIKIRIGDQTKTFRYNEKTGFVKDEKHIDPSKIQKGARVSVAFDSQNFAHRVKVETDSTTPE